jgi:hypothetical protein
MKFVCVTANKSACELERGEKARLHLNHDKKAEPPMNPPRVKKDPFAPKSELPKEKVLIKSPVGSAIRGQERTVPEPTNADIMKLLLETLAKK